MNGEHYAVVCVECGTRSADDGLITSCRGCADAALLRTDYRAAALPVSAGASGIFRYREWLPVAREIPGSSLPSVHRCQNLGAALGLTDLWVAFNGYWPERGSHLVSGTFKELEAFTVLARTPEDAGVMVVASAGNTAASFALAADQVDLPCVLVVPDRALPDLGVIDALHGIGRRVRIVAVKGGTYNDAIAYSQGLLAADPVFFPEGGVRNVARRDGLAVVMLAGYEAMGRLPDYYVQAVGSGTGAVAAHEASRRIAAQPGGGSVPRMLLCQNSEFAPLHRLWRHWEATGGAVAAGPGDGGAAGQRGTAGQEDVHAPELVNAAPPFAVRGGVRDILADSAGDVLVADGAAARAAGALFEETEGIDIEPAAAVAVACLREAVAAGRVPRDARVLLNITGGGRRRTRELVGRHGPEPDAWLVGTAGEPAATAAMVLDSLAL
ncbi:cysteate synthase [Kitasatospora sp. NBC_01302]|uniref:cysteate synthase n=1 Tax=Kitasatospora sp. NBC_01302 TaxID=2903575 RepID=UPI002E1570CA|nr:cysteate synthase [Kitasatospora sp. NBC_01302]